MFINIINPFFKFSRPVFIMKSSPSDKDIAVPSPGRKQDRRRFVKSLGVGSALAGMATSLPAASYAKVLGANERVRIGVIGIRGMGYGHIQGFSQLDNVEVVAICDIDENVLVN